MATVETCSCDASSLWEIVREVGDSVSGCELKLVVSESHCNVWWAWTVKDGVGCREAGRRYL
jgi:hypothetical protein